MFLVPTRRALFVFIPTNSEGQISVNLRKKTKRIKTKKKLNSSSVVRLNSRALLCSFFLWDPYVPFSFFLGPFQPRNKLFCLGFNFLYPN